VLYLFSSTAVSMILSPQAAQTSLAPYADALKANWGEGAADLAAAGISIAAIGGLNSNLLCGGELGYSMALRGDLPNRLARTRGANTPVNSLVLVALLAIVLVLFNTSKSTANLFMFVILLTTTATLVVYVVGAVAALKKRVSVPASIAIITAILFSLFAFYGAGLEANLWGLVLLIAGLAIRWLCHRINSRAGSSLAAEASPAAPAE
jgi:APA family basic amino acid/polyamine antiporter